MRIERPREVERFGAVQFGCIQKVFELDSGLTNNNGSGMGQTVVQVPYDRISEIQKDMAIVVPVRSERLKLVEGVLCGIPHSCLIIIVSNSPRQPVDRFRMEKDALHDFCTFVNKNALIVHQKDPLISQAFKAAGYGRILDRKGEVKDGKAEGMIIGKILAWLAGKKHVGFIDADNYFPGAVEEYIREYAAGLALSKSRYAMIRIAWHSKPKIVESKFFFRKWGRTSENTNRLLNRLISSYTGYETEIIKTGNSGEHAMTMDLALRLDFSSGYSIEPYHIINLIEKFGGLQKSPYPEVMKENVEIFQIESRNPHLHESGDEEHVDEMLSLAMQVIYHSSICPEKLQKEIRSEMMKRKLIKEKEDLPEPSYYPSLSHIDPRLFLKNLKSAPYARLIREGKV